MKFETDICVVGGGVIGKLAALGLAQTGRSVILLSSAVAEGIEVQPKAWDARVYAINPATRKLLQRLKIWDALEQPRIEAVSAMVVRGDRAQPSSQLKFDAYQAHAEALAWIIEDSNLNRTLDAALRFAPNLRVSRERATSVQSEAEAALLTLANGESIRCQLLIGADGAQSWVRNQFDIGIDYRPYAQRAIVANFAITASHRGQAWQWFSPTDGVIALLPLPGARMSLVWSAPAALADALLPLAAADDNHAALTAIAARLTGLPGQPFGEFQPLEPISVKSFALAALRPHAISAPRMLLIGDAAHVIHPLAGQGLNLGIGDLATLLDVLASDGAEDSGDARLLGRYSRRRQPEVLAMLAATDGLQRLFNSDAEPLCALRNIGLNLVDKLPGVKRQLIARAFGTTF